MDIQETLKSWQELIEANYTEFVNKFWEPFTGEYSNHLRVSWSFDYTTITCIVTKQTIHVYMCDWLEYVESKNVE